MGTDLTTVIHLSTGPFPVTTCFSVVPAIVSSGGIPANVPDRNGKEESYILVYASEMFTMSKEKTTGVSCHGHADTT